MRPHIGDKVYLKQSKMYLDVLSERCPVSDGSFAYALGISGDVYGVFLEKAFRVVDMPHIDLVGHLCLDFWIKQERAFSAPSKGKVNVYICNQFRKPKNIKAEDVMHWLSCRMRIANIEGICTTTEEEISVTLLPPLVKHYASATFNPSLTVDEMEAIIGRRTPNKDNFLLTKNYPVAFLYPDGRVLVAPNCEFQYQRLDGVTTFNAVFKKQRFKGDGVFAIIWHRGVSLYETEEKGR